MRGFVHLAGGVVLDREAVLADPRPFHQALERAYDLRRAGPRTQASYCSCQRAPGEALLAIRRLEDDRFVLARFPGSREQHDARCPFAAAGGSGRDAYVAGVVQAQPDGSLVVRLERALALRAPSSEPETSVEATGARSGSGDRDGGMRAMTPLGLLCLLYEEAGLATWRPSFAGKRSWSTLVGRLTGAAMHVRENGMRSGLERSLVCMRPGAPLAAVVAARNTLSTARGKRRVIVVGELRELAVGPRSARLVLVASAGLYETRLWLSLERAAMFERALPATLEGARRLVIAILEVQPSRDERTIDCEVILAGALAVETASWIPVASSYELRITQMLIEQQRAFTKPLRYDVTEPTFPDFELEDVGSTRFPMEVFGRSDEVYRNRMAHKIVSYDERFGPQGWWSWDAALAPDPPPFPLAKGAF